MVTDSATDHLRVPQTNSVDPWDVIHLFRSHAIHIFLCVVLSLGAAWAYLWYAKPVYSSRALVEVAQDERPGNADADSDMLKTIELKLASQSVLLGVIKNNHLADDADFAPVRPEGAYSDSELVKIMSRKVNVGLVRGSRLISVTGEDHDPQKAQHLVQSVVDQFFQQAYSDRRTESAASRAMLLAEAKRVGDELKDSEEKLQSYREKYNTVSLVDKQNIVVERMKDLNQQVALAKNTRVAMENDRQRVLQMVDTDPEQLLNIRSIATLPEIVDLRKEVDLQQAQIATMSQRYGPLHPTMLQAKSQLTELRSALHNAIKKAGDVVQQSYESAHQTELSLEKALADQEKASLDLDRISIPYHTLERQVQSNASIYQQTLDRLRQSDVTNGMINSGDRYGNNIRVVEAPMVPIKPLRPDPKLVIALALVGGIILGCGVTLGSKALDNTVPSVDAAESFLGLSVLATIPRTRRRKAESGPVVQLDPASAEAEAFRSLRTSLYLLKEGEEKRTILFTSAVPGEGKSYCSLNYAAALAQEGFKTLLIDGDLRRPSIQRMYGDRTGKPGLADCLKHPELFPAVVQTTSTPNLFLLGDAFGRPGAAELISKDGFQTILDRALGIYDRVVIDTAPLTAVSDTLYIAKYAPIICLVIHAGKTPRRLVRRACRLLDEVAKKTPTGIVLNKIHRGSSAQHYYYYSGEAYTRG